MMERLDSNEYGGIFQKFGRNSEEDSKETDYEKFFEETLKNPTKRRFLKS